MTNTYYLMTVNVCRKTSLDKQNIDVCKILMPPFPNICIIGLTFDLNINRDHLLIKDYLPTKFGVSGAKRS